MNPNDISKFKQLFIEEVTTLLNSMEGIILDLEQSPDNSKLIGEIFRVMHTIKGVSGMYGFQGMSDLTHHIENIYDLIRNGKLPVSQDVLNLTLKSVDLLFAQIKDQHLSDPENAALQQELLKEWNQMLGMAKNKKTLRQPPVTAPTSAIVTYNILLHTPQSVVDRRINLFYTIKDLSEIGEIRAINSLPVEADEEERWSIFVVGEMTPNDVEDALMFVFEYCIIRKVADFDLFDSEACRKQTIELSAQEEVEETKANPSKDKIESQPIINCTSPKTDKTLNTIESIRQNMNKVSVESEKLDHLMYLVSELITTTSQLNLGTQSKAFESIRSQMEKLDKLSKQFRNNALDIRLIPIGDIIPKFNRLVRDTSKALGKEVEFITEGMETELDKSSIDMIAEPLVHMVRNALDHGLECPEERLEHGKEAKGIIRLKAYNSGNNIFIEISDDGHGLDKNKIISKAIEKGIIKSADTWSDKEIYNLICHPGFSTAQVVTSLSGRGVGMDVVMQKIKQMRGELEIDSASGKGTKFTIKLQQSITIMDTLLIRSAEMKYLLPLTDVEVCSQYAYADLKERIRHGTIGYEQELIPFVSLRHLLELDANAPRMTKMVILNKNGKRIAIFADEIIGQHQAVLKPMGDLVKNHKAFSAASVLGNGEVAFLLDTNSIQFDSYTKAGS